MNTFKRVLSCFMAVLIVCTLFSPVSATAANVTDSVATISSESSAITTISLGVGSNETERNITWQSNIAEAGKVQYAKKSADAFPALYKEVQAVSKSATNSTNYVNKATIDGLEPSTEYVYRIVVGENVSPVYSFKTDSKGDFSFLFVGDPQIGGSGSAYSEADSKNWETTLNAAVAAFPNSSLLVSAGDQVNVATNEEQYAYYFAPAVMQSLTNATVIGNHDTGSIAYSEHFNNPNIVSSDNKTYGATTAGSDYWYTYNHTLFLNLNTNNLSTAEHIAFMENAIAENPNVRWKIVVFHHALYGATYHALEDNVKQLRNTLAPAFMDLGIDVVLTGHEHVYTRSYMMDGLTPDTSNGVQSSVTDPSGILYITANSSTGSKYYDIYTGAAFEYAAVINQEKVPTFSNVEISARTFKITTYRVSDLSVVDSFEINKQTVAPEIVSQQLVLGDNLNMRFWVKADSKYDAINVTVGSGESEKVSLATAQQDADGNYIINVSLAPAQMTDVITLQPVAGDVTGTAKQYTVLAYAKKILQGNYGEQTTGLVRAMLNYGGYSQVYFDYNNTPEQLANKDCKDVYTEALPAELEVTMDGAMDGVQIYGATLVLRDRIALRYYFTGSSEGITVDSGDKPHAVVEKNGQFYVELANINPQDYSTNYTVKLTKGEETLALTYSVMHYITRKGITGSEDLQNLLKALFAYHNAAITYNEWIADCDNLAEYTVVYGDNATDNEKTARDMIVEYIWKSTGVTLPIIPASEAEYTADAKYLVIGDTGLGGFAPAADLDLRGYQIKSVDNSVFVCGGTDLGTLSGAVGFLEQVIGLDAYGYQTVNYNKQSEILIDDFDLTVVPDVGMEQPPFSMVSGSAWNQALWGVGQKMFSTIEGSSNHWHNSFDYLPPAEYLDAHPEYYVTEGYLWNKKAVQLSYTANGDAEAFEEMTTICANKIISSAKNNASMKAVTLTMQDNMSWDESPAAEALLNKYGTHSAEVIIFMNAVADKVKAGLPADRELDIYFFAYFNTYAAPVKEVNGEYVAIDSNVEMRDNVGVIYAPINGDFLVDDFTATTMYEELSGWAALTDNIATWTYQTNFDNYFTFYNSFNVMPSMYSALADFSTDYSYMQGQWNNPNSTGFSHLKTYLTGKLSWNADADFETLLDNYFAARFGSASSEMRTLFDSMRAYYDKLQDTYGISGGINQSGEYLRTDRFEKAEIEKWLGYLDAAYAKADNDTIKSRITLESLAVRYLMLELYADTMNTNERMVMMQAFKQDCAAQNIQMFSEGKTIDYLWEQWDSGNIQEIEGIYYNFDLSLGLTSYEIPVPASIGTITAVYDNSYIAIDGVTIGANSVTFSSEAVNALLNGKSYGDFALYLTNADQIYKVNVAVVTQMIDSYDDLVAIKANQAGNVLDGYYALANDIDATGEDAICLIEYNDAMWQSYSSGVGFKGIFDGRGYTISNLTAKTGSYAKIGGFFGQILQGAIVRDIAFMDMTTDNVNAYTYLLTGESCRMMGKVENVVISAKGEVAQAFGILGCDPANTENATRFNMKNVVISGVDYIAYTVKVPSTFENIILVSDEGVVVQMSASAEDEAATNSIIRYSTNEELFAALNEENIIAQWEDSGITYENTAIKFNGKAIITELMNIVEEEAVIGGSTNLTVQGSVTLSLKEAVDGVSISGNTLTVASNVKTGTKVTVVATSTVSGVTKEFVITLQRTYTDADLGAMDVEIGAESASMAVSGISGNAECLIYGTTTVYEGYTIADGQITISKDLLDAMYTKLGLGEHIIYLGTDASVRYAITLTMATKIINTVEDLESISTTEATLDGYYVLNADLDCSGKTIALLAGAQNPVSAPNVGFKGTFDGRGHIIFNLTTKNGIYQELGGVFGQLCAGAVVKNVAFVNLTSESKHATNGIGYLLTGDGSVLYGTLENVAVIGNDSKARVVSALTNASGKIENCFFANIGEISSNGDKAIVNNVLSATSLGRNPSTNGPWGGFAWSGNATYNAQPNYKTVNDMIIALSADNVIADWTDALFTYADGQILYNGKLLVQYDLDLQGADTIYRGTSQSYLSANMIDLMLKNEIDGVSVEWAETDEENGIDIFTLTVDASVPVGTEIVLVAYSYEFESVTKEIVVTVQKRYTDIDLTAEGNMADIEVTDGASVAVRFTVEGIGYGDSGMVTEGVSYADGKLSLTKAAIDAIVAEVGLGEKTLKLYTTDDKCYAVTVTFATKLISNLSDLKSITTTGNTLDGYYVLTDDIDCNGESFKLVGTWSGSLTTGFVGIFDGRGHTISNYNGGTSGLFYCLGAKAVVKNVAFTNISGTAALGGSETHGATFENVFVGGSVQYMTRNGFDAPKYKNVVFMSSHPNAALFVDGNNNNNNGTMTLTNVFVVGEKIHGYYGGTMNEVNAVVYANMDALLTAISAEGELDKWAGSSFGYEEGKLLFNGKVVCQAPVTLTGPEVIVRGTSETYTSNGIISLKNPINGVSVENGVLTVANTVAENTIITLVATHKDYPAITTELNVQVTKVYDQIDWTELGSIGDLETADANSYIQLPADMNGNVIGISYGENSMNSEVSVTDGILSVSKAWVTEVYNAYGYTEQSVKLYTDADKCYTVKVAIVTKAIGSFEELKSIAVAGNTLDGYYVLMDDIDCNGESFKLVGTWSGSLTTGFVGTFDGRGHTISNYNGETSGLFYCLGAKAVVKNVAFTNISGTAALGGSEMHGATFENVFVGGSVQYITRYGFDAPKYKNVVFMSSHADAMLFYNGNNNNNNGTMTLTNVFVVGKKIHDYYGGTMNEVNAVVYANMDALLTAISAEGELDKWAGSSFSYEEGKLLFAGKVMYQAPVSLTGPEVIIRGTSETYISDGIITLKTPIDGVSIDNGVLTVANTVSENTIITLVATHKDYPAITTELNVQVTKVYEQIDWTELGSIGDLETADANSYIQLPADMNGNVIGISYGENSMNSEISVIDGVLSVSKAWVTEVYNAYGYTEQSIKLYTDADKCYTVKVAIVTKAIGTFEELESVAVSGNTLNGYFVLTNDIYCEGKHVHLVGSWTNTKTTGFIGTFDGRGHIIDGFNGESNRGLFYCTGAGVIKNVAFTNATGTVVLANGEIHGTTFENIFVSGSAQYLMVNAFDGPTFKNVVFNSTFDGGDGRIYKEGTNGTLTINNLLVVGTRTHGYWGGTSNVTNANAVGDTTALITALSAEGELEKWAGSSFSVADGKLLFGGKPVCQVPVSLSGPEVIVRGTSETYTSNGIITVKNPVSGVSMDNGVLTVAYTVPVDTTITLVATHSKYPSITTEMNVQVSMVYEEIDLTDLGSIGDLETVDSYSYIELPDEIVGNVTGISYGDTAKYTNISVTDGELVIPKAWVTEVYNAYGYTEQSIKLYTNADKSYTVKVSVVTKAIENLADLKSIATKGDTLDGYYVLTEDIGCDSTTFSLVAGWNNKLTTGFIGTFDGRGHIIDGYNGGDTGLFYCTGAKAVIKNVAFTNATGSRVLASTQIHGTTFENVFVSGSAQYFTANGFSAPKYKNVIFVSSHPNAALFIEGNNNNNNGTMTLTNVFVVGEKIHGYYGGTMNEVNANTYATVEAMMAALSAEGELDKWTGSPYSIVDGKLFFAGKPLSFTEATLNTPVSLGDVEAAAKENVINVPAEITGNIIGISSGNTGRMTDGVEYENGKLTLSQKTVEGLAAGGWGETSLKIYTDEGKYYTVSVCLVTKAIGTFEELKSIAVAGNTLDGYFVLTNDIYCEGEHVHLVGTYASTATTGFVGTFDGRGHIIDGFNGESNRGLFYCTGAGVIKNVAFTNATGTVVLANGEIHGTTFENIFVSGSARYLVANAWHSPTFKNVVFNSTFDGGDGRIYNEGNFGTLTINNLLVVGTRTHGYWGGTSNVTNANAVGDTTALITALSAEGELDKWAGSGFSVEDGKLLFNGKVVIG